MRKQRGLWVGKDCFDDTRKIRQPRTRWGNVRDNSNTTILTAAATPEIFIISAAGGINLIGQSHELAERRDGRHKSFFMRVASDGGAVTLTANPQIIAAQTGDMLTLRGTSDINTLTITDDKGVRTFGGQNGVGAPMVLGDGDAISFVFTEVKTGWGTEAWGSAPWGSTSVTDVPTWVETSRFKGGI